MSNVSSKSAKVLSYVLFKLGHLFALHPDLSFPSSLNPPPPPPPFLLRKWEASHRYQSVLAYQVAVGLGVSSPVVARQSSPVTGKGFRGRQQSQRQHPVQRLGDLT